MLWPQVMYPIEQSRTSSKLRVQEIKSGRAALSCLAYDSTAGPATGYCVDEGRLDLRTEEREGFGATFNRIFVFQHHFVAGDTRISDLGVPVLNLTVDEIRSMRSDEGAALDPPAGAAKADALIDAREGDLASGSQVAGCKPLAKQAPWYPREAKARGAQGTVRLAVTIGKDGAVLNPVLVHDLDPLLNAAAMQAVSQWRYEPCLVSGQPVQMDTLITINFRLGG